MMMISGRLLPSLVAFCLVSAVGVAAETSPRHAPSEAQQKNIERTNRWLAEFENSRETPKVAVSRPYAEFERGKYVIISAASGWDSLYITTSIARYLPADMTLVVLAQNSSEERNAYQTYRAYLSDSRLKVVNIGTSSGIWTRDSLPIPIWTDEHSVGLVDARYFHGNEPDAPLAQWFRLPLLRHNYYFEGGNLMNDDAGNCFIVGKSQTSSISDDVFRSYYGCKQMNRLHQTAGIGHVDERLKVISRNHILTDETQYFATLRNLGYDVTMLPRPRSPMGTYANALLINGVVFLPTYRETTDREAQAVYERLGYKVIPVPSSQISSQGKGSVHCITMVYPSVSERDLVAALRR